MKRTILAGAAALGLGLVLAAPAQADSPRAAWDCPDNRLCVWTGNNGTGARAVFANGDVNLNAAPGPSGMNNNISSYRNNTDRNWSFHDGVNYNGRTRYAQPRTYGYVGDAMDNETSSIKKRR
jgi:hypothetical protein